MSGPVSLLDYQRDSPKTALSEYFERLDMGHSGSSSVPSFEAWFDRRADIFDGFRSIRTRNSPSDCKSVTLTLDECVVRLTPLLRNRSASRIQIANQRNLIASVENVVCFARIRQEPQIGRCQPFDTRPISAHHRF